MANSKPIDLDRRTTYLDIVSQIGPDGLVREAKQLQEEIAELNTRPLPAGLRRFTDDDWMGYAGASRLPDGTLPIINDKPRYVLVDHNDGLTENNDTNDKPTKLGDIVQVQIVFSDGFLLGFDTENGKVFTKSFSAHEPEKAWRWLFQLNAMMEHKILFPCSLAFLLDAGFDCRN